ncbi:MAG: S-layer homology domain-containing protein [Firmicutes bacterium]|nr:S-layer homology domain-containing protein [Bacillota bacterium]
MVRVARANDAAVGVSKAPASISFDGKEVDLSTGTAVSERNNVFSFTGDAAVAVDGEFEVKVDAPEGSHVYINNNPEASVTYDKIPEHKIVRVIVQNDECEPLIYVFNLWEMTDEEKADAAAAEVAKAVDEKIEAIGNVTLESAAEIQAARDAYEALTDSQKALVGNLAVLEAAEKALEDLKSGSGSDDTIQVTFRLIGSTKSTQDVDLSKGEEGYYTAEYQNWIKTRAYTMHSDDSVYDLFVKATGDAGIESKGANKGYVSAVKAPDSLGGYWLEEFTNGKYSGWMYTMDGKHTNAIKDQKLKDGADVVFHYVNDYRYEVEDWFDEPAYPSAATDGEFYNRWLEAADVRPGSQGGGTAPVEEPLPEEPTEGGTAADRFIDVDEDDWFSEAVDYAVENGFMVGTGEDTFSPQKTLTRGMLASMLYSMEGAPAEDGTTDFTDVDPSDWFAKGVEWAVENGVAAGYGERFGPNDDITREQMVVMLYGYAKMKGYELVEGEDLSGYEDAGEISSWALPAMQWAKAAGLVSGRSATKMAPQGTTTRAEAATIMRNFLENVAK